jgi:hypothetical protein
VAASPAATTSPKPLALLVALDVRRTVAVDGADPGDNRHLRALLEPLAAAAGPLLPRMNRPRKVTFELVV